MKPKRLGRGLSGLIKTTDDNATEELTPPPRGTVAPSKPAGSPAPAVAPAPSGAPAAIPIGEIVPNPFQPREVFDDEALQELAASIREHGVLQPVVVRRGVRGYELIAGERRWRAAGLAGLATLPAVVRPASDAEMQTLALVENLQREDLNAIEKARALRAMMRNLDMTQEAVAERVGKARATIANLLRLLELPDEVQTMVEAGALSGAHARALLRAKTPDRRLRLAKEAVQGGWSVREIEQRTAGDAGGQGPARAKPAATENPYLADVVDRVRQALGTKVRILPKGSGGTIELTYHDARDLDRLLEAFGA
ncbi:MAG: ParB/RepB/Spo0J family partition protein [Planctomycetota bacterium]